MQTLDIVGLCGSLRAASYNKMVLKLAADVMPKSMRLEVAEWRSVPVFDADLLAKGFPPDVAQLRERIRRADGVLFATPEYNFSIPGGLKNVIDWISRGDDQPFSNKAVAIVSATGGPLGGGRMQYDLRRAMLFLNAQVLAKPEVFIGSAHTKFAADGTCTDEATRKFVGDLMASFERWVAAVERLTSV